MSTPDWALTYLCMYFGNHDPTNVLKCGASLHDFTLTMSIGEPHSWMSQCCVVSTITYMLGICEVAYGRHYYIINTTTEREHVRLHNLRRNSIKRLLGKRSTNHDPDKNNRMYTESAEKTVSFCKNTIFFFTFIYYSSLRRQYANFPFL